MAGSRWVAVVRRVLVILGLTALGALGGLAAGVATPAHVEIAGSDTRIWLEPGATVDQVGAAGLVTLTRATPRALLGEPVGVRAVIDVDASQFVSNGQLNTDVVPAYVAAYSDPEQLVSDVRHELIWHLARWVIAGAVLVLLLVAARWGYRRWRAAYDRRHFADGSARATSLAYRRRERLWVARGAAALVVLLVVGLVPSARRHAPAPRVVTGNPVLAGTPLADVEVSGLLSPALVAARNYIETYAGQTDRYYDRLRRTLLARLDTGAITLPTGRPGEDVAHLGFVTDRHCNTGMDRVTVALLDHFRVTTLVSAGDDAFSGTFAFEAACTRNLAQQSLRAGVTVVAVGGNHDSARTVRDERDQGIRTLENSVVEADGVRFVGSPDPRTSRYGEGIRPASAEDQQRVLREQTAELAKTACDSSGPLVVVAHDPSVGTGVLRDGCGRATLALDGHTHTQAGPVAVPLPDGETGSQFTGASGGGAPSEASIDRTFASSLTVGPLHNDAHVYVVSVDRNSGRLVGVTAFTFTPAQDISISQDVG